MVNWYALPPPAAAHFAALVQPVGGPSRIYSVEAGSQATKTVTLLAGNGQATSLDNANGLSASFGNAAAIYDGGSYLLIVDKGGKSIR